MCFPKVRDDLRKSSSRLTSHLASLFTVIDEKKQSINFARIVLHRKSIFLSSVFYWIDNDPKNFLHTFLTFQSATCTWYEHQIINISMHNFLIQNHLSLCFSSWHPKLDDENPCVAECYPCIRVSKEKN